MHSFHKLFFGLILILTTACAQQGTSEDMTSTTESPSAPTQSAGKHSWWQPTAGTSWQIQLTDAIDTSIDAQVYDIDLIDTDAQLIAQLHAKGRKVVCYFSAGSIEDWRPDAKNFPSEVLGKDYENWPGERWLDIRQIEKLAPVMSDRMDLAVQKKCDAVDPDNVDAYAIDSGFPLSEEDQLAYNRWLASEAHRRGLAIGLKNDLGQIEELVADFDFAVNEECFESNECNDLLPFVQANKPVWNIEYNGNPEAFCPIANQKNFDTLKKDLDLGAARQACR